MDNQQSVETNDLGNKSKKKIFATVFAVIFFSICSYFGYDYYQSKQYIEKISSIYNVFSVIDQDVLAIPDKSTGKRFVDLFDEVKTLKKNSKDLKLKFSEVTPQNTKSHEINNKFNELLDLQNDMIDNYNLLFQGQMDYQSSKEYIKQFEGNPYSERSIESARNEMKKADEDLDKAYKKHESLISKYKDEKLKFTQLMGK